MVDTLIHLRKSRWYGLSCTIGIMVALLLFFWLFIIRTPNPPYPDAGGGAGNGIEVNLGFSDIPVAQPIEAVLQSSTSDVEEDIATQDIEDAPIIVEKSEKTIPKKKDSSTKEPQPVKKNEPLLNTRALYPAQSKSTNTQGTPNGSLGAKAFGGHGGSGGTGGGTGGGVGTGSGSGSGSGISFNLSGRIPQVLPTPEYTQQVEGVVVVAVTVDKDGRVTQAEPGVKGSTTLDDGLLTSAKKAALQARFDKKAEAPAFQKGTISYRFRLQ